MRHDQAIMYMMYYCKMNETSEGNGCFENQAQLSNVIIVKRAGDNMMSVDNALMRGKQFENDLHYTMLYKPICKRLLTHTNMYDPITLYMSCLLICLNKQFMDFLLVNKCNAMEVYCSKDTYSSSTQLEPLK